MKRIALVPILSAVTFHNLYYFEFYLTCREHGASERDGVLLYPSDLN